YISNKSKLAYLERQNQNLETEKSEVAEAHQEEVDRADRSEEILEDAIELFDDIKGGYDELVDETASRMAEEAENKEIIEALKVTLLHIAEQGERLQA